MTTTIVTRANKGSPLTNTELDSNFTNLKTTADAAISSTGNNTLNGNLIVTGDLEVQGTTTSIDSTTVEITDLNITLAKDATNNTQANGAGITIAGSSAELKYLSTGDKWTLNKNLEVSGTIQDSNGTFLPASSVSTFGGTLIDDADAAAARTTLGLGTMATSSSSDFLALSGGTLTGTLQGTRLGLGVAPHSTAALNITTTNQHIRLNNGSELGVISLLSGGELDIWGHGDGETINFRTGSGSGTVALAITGTNSVFSGSVSTAGNIVNDIGNSGDDSFIELKNTGYTGNITSLRQNADSIRAELNSTERSIFIQAGSGGGVSSAEVRLYTNTQLGLKIDASQNLSIPNGSVGIGFTSAPSATLDIRGTNTYNKIVSYFSGSYISGFQFSDLNGSIFYDAGTDDLTVSAGHANSKLILASGGSTALTLLSDQSATFSGSVTTGGNITSGNNGNINIPTASSGNANMSFDGSNFTIVSNSSSANLKLQTLSQDTLTIAANGNLTHHRGNATFSGSVTSTGLTINASGGRQYINNGHLRLGDGYKLEWGGGTNFITGNNSTGAMSLTATSDMTLDTAGNIVLDADGGGVYFKDGGTNIGFLQNSGANDFRIVSGQVDKDIVFMGNDGGSVFTALTLDMSNAGRAFFNVGASFSDDVAMGDNNKTKYGQGEDLILYSDGTNGEIEAPNGNLTLDVAGAITLDADSGGDVIFSDGGTAYGKLSKSSNDLIVTSTIQNGDIIFKGDDGGANIIALTLDMSDSGTAIFNSDIRLFDSKVLRLGNDQDFRISFDGSHGIIQNVTTDSDIIFKGNDGGSAITALTLDMSAAGAATFNSTISSGAITSAGLTSSGDAVFQGNVTHNNNNASSKYFKLNVASSGDGHLLLQRNNTNYWQIHSDGSNVLKFDGYNGASSAVFSGSVSLLDDKLLMLGTGNDARLKFDTSTNALMITATNGTADKIRTQSNNLSLEQANGSKYISATANDSVKLYYADSPVVKTTAGGLVVESGMNFNMTGSMMIGATTAPSGKLHIKNGASGATYTADGADQVILENNDSLMMDIRTPSGNTGGILFSDNNARGRGVIQYAHSNDTMYINTAGASALTLDSSQNATFSGSVSAGGLKIDGGTLSHASSNASSITISGGSNATNGMNMSLGGSSGSLSQSVVFKQNSSEKMRLTSTGLGLGTSVPTQTLHIATGHILVERGVELRSKDTSGSVRTIARVNGSNELEYGWSGNGKVKIMGGGSYTERFSIGTDGNANFAGVLTANAGVQIDALNLDGRTIASTDTNGNINIHPNGSGTVNVSTSLMVGATTAPSAKLQIQGGTSGLDQISISSNTTADTTKYAGIIMTNYANTTTALLGAKAENGTSSVFYGSSGSDHRGIQNHIFYTNSSATATSGNIERLRIDSSGIITVKGDGSSASEIDSNTVGSNVFLDLGGYTGTPSVARGIRFFENNASGSKTEKMRLSGGNLLVGTTTTAVANGTTVGIALTSGNQLAIGANNDVTAYFNRINSDGTIAEFRKDGSAVGALGSNSAGGVPVFDISTHPTSGIMRMLTSGSERMRLLNNGSLLIGGTSASASGTTSFSASGSGQINLNASNTGGQCLLLRRVNHNGNAITFENADEDEVGSITMSSNATAYNTSSDARLKDVTGTARGLEVINKLNPVSYNWKSDGKADEGLIAQEVLDVVPNAVSVSEKDIHQLDYSKLIVHLVAGMKEQQELITTLQAQVALLKEK